MREYEETILGVLVRYELVGRATWEVTRPFRATPFRSLGEARVYAHGYLDEEHALLHRNEQS